MVGSELNPGKMDFRDYGIGAQVLAALGIKSSDFLPGTAAGWLVWKDTGWKLWSRTLYHKDLFQ